MPIPKSDEVVLGVLTEREETGEHLPSTEAVARRAGLEIGETHRALERLKHSGYIHEPTTSEGGYRLTDRGREAVGLL